MCQSHTKIREYYNLLLSDSPILIIKERYCIYKNLFDYKSGEIIILIQCITLYVTQGKLSLFPISPDLCSHLRNKLE